MLIYVRTPSTSLHFSLLWLLLRALSLIFIFCQQFRVLTYGKVSLINVPPLFPWGSDLRLNLSALGGEGIGLVWWSIRKAVWRVSSETSNTNVYHFRLPSQQNNTSLYLSIYSFLHLPSLFLPSLAAVSCHLPHFRTPGLAKLIQMLLSKDIKIKHL